MKNLAQSVMDDVFEQPKTVDEALVREYFERNERKKEDDKWLKANKNVVLTGLQELGKQKADFGDLRVSYTEPDNSKFDMEKVMDYILQFHPDLGLTKLSVDEEKLTVAIDEGKIDIESLKDYAWEQSKGTPRLTIAKVKK